MFVVDTTPPRWAAEFGARPDISARSVLVTVFGDSVVPAGGEIWLGDLIELCAPFGFNDRLVRTSMYRLTGEGWFDTERVGRRSRYRLTTTATAEFAHAETRIYHRPDRTWDENWTLVFLNGEIDAHERRELRSALLPRGYVALASSVLGRPRDDADAARHITGEVGAATTPVALARFANLAELVEAGWGLDAFGLEDPGRRYAEFVVRYDWLRSHELPALGDRESWLLRTVIVHELRRARLVDPDLPTSLLPTDWQGDAAFDLASSIYREVTRRAWYWLDETAGIRPAAAPPVRF